MMNRPRFYDGVRPIKELFGGRLTQSQVDGMENLFNVWDKYFLKDTPDFLTYDLATAMIETGRTMQPITEWGPRSYFDKYEPGTKLGKMLGNTMRGDGYRYRGEGHVMNTGRRNAAYATKRINEVFHLDIDLVEHPEMRGDPFISAISLFLGNKEGWWTGKYLGKYIDGVDESDKEDLREFVNARFVVNGTDRALDIGNLALKLQPIVRAALA